MSLKRSARLLADLEDRLKRSTSTYAEVSSFTPQAILQLIETSPGLGMARYLGYIGRYGFGLEDLLGSLESPDGVRRSSLVGNE
jgi:hypothetical protein